MVSFRKGLGDRNKLFQKSLASLLWYTTYPFELILIDNTENNRGLGMARNEGASRAIGEYVVFTDDDIFFKKGWEKRDLCRESQSRFWSRTSRHI